MQAAFAKIVPHVTRLAHQTFPSVIATLIAAGLIAGYNRAFSGHLQQPRMSALHQLDDAGAVDVTPKAAMPAADYFATLEHVTPDRLRGPLEKSAAAEAGKDQSTLKLATATPAQPAQQPAARMTPRQEPRSEPRVVSIEPAPAVPPVASAPAMPAPLARPAVTAPVVAQPLPRDPAAPAAVVAPAPPAVVMVPQPSLPEPPPVFVAAPQPVVAQPAQQTAQPMVTVPDRPGMRPVEVAQDPPPAPPHGPIGALVNTLSPSSLFARARAFGERIEAAGNDLLPNIRQ